MQSGLVILFPCFFGTQVVVITTTAEMPVIPIDISIITREMNIAQEMVESREASSGVVGSGVRNDSIRHSIL